MVMVINMPREEFRVIIAGGRDFARNGWDKYDWNLLYTTMDKLLQNKRRTHRIVVLCGMAKGADMAGNRYALQRRFLVRYFPADWQEYGKKAGPIRNDLMAQNADALVAFWDGQSPGTKNMIETAKKYNLQVRVIPYRKEKPEDKLDEFGYPVW